jgi:glycosyltransferase involved in cell wall biosynthesis
MKLAQLMAGAEAGGAELFFERLCAGLARSGDEVLPVIRRNAARAARLRASGLAPVEMGFGGVFDVWTRPLMARRLRRFAPRVAVAWMGRAARHAPRGPWILVGRLGGYYDLRRFARCEHLVGNTQGVVDWIVRQGVPPARVHKLPNFVADQAGGVPASLGMPSGAPVVLGMGRLHRNKGFDVLIAAISRLPGVHAAIAGDGPERVALERLAQHAGVAERVHFLGWRSDTASLLAACDVLACPSRSEPLGNVILEAFSARRPVVAAMAEGPRELISSGRTGVLVAQESAIALAAGIEGVLQNPQAAAAMVRAGRDCYEQAYSEGAVVQRWREFLGSVSKADPIGTGLGVA